jgi:hypothetical protein
MAAACSSKTSITSTIHYSDASQKTAYFTVTTMRTTHLRHSLAQHTTSHTKEKSGIRRIMHTKAPQFAISLKMPRQHF